MIITIILSQKEIMFLIGLALLLGSTFKTADMVNEDQAAQVSNNK